MYIYTYIYIYIYIYVCVYIHILLSLLTPPTLAYREHFARQVAAPRRLFRVVSTCPVQIVNLSRQKSTVISSKVDGGQIDTSSRFRLWLPAAYCQLIPSKVDSLV